MMFIQVTQDVILNYLLGIIWSLFVVSLGSVHILNEFVEKC